MEQETHEVLQADRLDLPAQTFDGIAVNTRQQVAFAPLSVNCIWAEMPPEHMALGLEPGQCLLHISDGLGQRRRKLGNGGRPMTAEPGTQQFGQRQVVVHWLIEAWQWLDHGRQAAIGVDGLQQRQALTGQPQLLLGQVDGSAPLGKLIKQRTPACACLSFWLADGAQAHQRFMHFIRVDRLRPGLGCH